MDKKTKFFVGASGILAIVVFILLMLFQFSVSSIFPLSQSYSLVRQAAAILLFIYSTVILAFLGGAHWAEAIKSNNLSRIYFSLWPLFLACIGILILVGFFGFVGFGFLLMAGVYGAAYDFETHRFPLPGLPDFAVKMRKRLYLCGALTMLFSCFFYYFGFFLAFRI